MGTSEDDDSDDEGTVVISRDDDMGHQDQGVELECQDRLCRACRAKASRHREKITGLLEAALKCNLIHILTLLWLIRKMSQRFKIRKAQFQADLERFVDYVEDENLADIDSIDMLVPIGYDFIGIIVLVGWIIFLCEYICSSSRTRRFR